MQPAGDAVSAPMPTSRFITAPDGLKLHVRCYGPGAANKRTVVCLPGLARTSADFEALANALSRDGRRVLALDYRGRGLSDYDKPENYTLAVELADVLAILTALEATPAIFIGTSRGGLITMLAAAVHPSAIAAAVLNDIGPVIETQGLIRIKGYVGKLPGPKNFADGAEVLQRLFGRHFPRLAPDDWLSAAHRTFKEEHGRLVPTYDVRLAETLGSIDPETALPSMWAQFDALAPVPVLVIRGANSDLLSPATVAAMQARHPNLEAFEVPDQGHAPLLADDDTIARIASFVARVDP